MHMADALVSPEVALIGGIAAIGASAYSIRQIKHEEDFEKKVPLMGVVGAFVFAAQMVNFTIPGTGSSGHICGGVLLSAILGPEAGFLSILSILIIQSLFFGDGGILALGCNVVNMGLFGCFIGYKLFFRNVTKNSYSKSNIFLGSIGASIIGLQAGALGVVIETMLSNITELPATTFLLFMQPIHLVIGLIEGIITGMILNFVYSSRPDILENAAVNKNSFSISLKRIGLIFLICSVIIGGGISLFASSNPDGLEWSILNVTGSEELENSDGIHGTVSKIQEKTSIMPDYNLDIINEDNFGQVCAGIIGVFITLIFIVVLGYLFKKKKYITTVNGNRNEY